MDCKYELRVKSVVRGYHFTKLTVALRYETSYKKKYIEKIHSHNKYAVTITVDRK